MALTFSLSFCLSFSPRSFETAKEEVGNSMRAACVSTVSYNFSYFLSRLPAVLFACALLQYICIFAGNIRRSPQPRVCGIDQVRYRHVNTTKDAKYEKKKKTTRYKLLLYPFLKFLFRLVFYLNLLIYFEYANIRAHDQKFPCPEIPQRRGSLDRFL